MMAKLEEVVDAKLKARLATAGALASLPPPPAKSTKPKAKAGMLASLMSASGFTADGKDTVGPGAANSAAAVQDAPEDGGDPDVDPISDSDEDADGAKGDTVKKRSSTAVDLSKPIGALLWNEEVLPYGSALAFVRMYQFKEARNRHECENLAWSLDAMVKDRIPITTTSFEIQVRRLLGVKLADEHGDWNIAEALAWKSGHGVQNRGLLRSLLKDRKNFAEFNNKPPKVRTGQAFRGGRGGARGGKGAWGRGGKGAQSKFGGNAASKPTSASGAEAARG
jgi:hypothetical protein